MKLEEPKQWYCDSCGLVIEKAEDGWLEWYEDTETNQSAGFRIVHHDQRCQYNWGKLDRKNKSLSDGHLQNFTGYDGFSILLGMFDYANPTDPHELTEIIRRIHLPNYEEARQYWDEAKEDGYVSGERESVTDYFQNTLIGVINRYGSK
jgi:hypothetical protein